MRDIFLRGRSYQPENNPFDDILLDIENPQAKTKLNYSAMTFTELTVLVRDAQEEFEKRGTITRCYIESKDSKVRLLNFRKK